MSALEEVLAALRQAASQAQAGREAMSAGMDAWDQRRYTLEWWLTGTNNPDALEVLGQHEATTEVLRSAFQQVISAVETIEGYARDLQGAPSDSGGVSPGGTSGGGSAGEPPAVTAPDGSRYPDAAAGVVDAMEPRVRTGKGDKTVGIMDGAVGQPITSGSDESWSPEVRKNAVARGVPPQTARYLAAHVEMKAAELMIREGRQHSELVINNVPCDLVPGKGIGCEQALEKYLPAGSTLTVHGTTHNGNPFTRTYKGKA